MAPDFVDWQTRLGIPPGTRVEFIVKAPTSGTSALLVTKTVDTGPTSGHVTHGYSDHVSIDKFIERNWSLGTISSRSRDNFPNPITGNNPYVPVNGPALDDLFDAFNFSK